MMKEILEELQQQSRELTALFLAVSEMQARTSAMNVRLQMRRDEWERQTLGIEPKAGDG